MTSTPDLHDSPSAKSAPRFWQPPYVGIVTAVLMILAIGLAHAMMVAFADILGQQNAYVGSIVVGFLAVIALWFGVISKNENFATWIGFLTAIVVWMTWVEFFYMWYGRENIGIMPRIYAGDDVGEPEYLIMSATVGLLLTMLVYYTFDKDTRCNMFLFFQKHLRLKEGLGPSTKTARDRNYAIITFMETFYVTWFMYAWNLLIFDPGFVGYGDGAFYASAGTVFLSIVWGGYCFSRLIKYKRTSTALRYAIPTANILWISIEISSHWGWLTEIWLQPWVYPFELSLFLGAFVVMSVLIYRAPKKPSEVGDW